MKSFFLYGFLILTLTLFLGCSDATSSDSRNADDRAFLEQNAQQEGVTVTSSGLQYRVIEEGTGPSPSTSSTVRVHYRGKLIDGTEFDSSYSRGQPATFPLQNVIPGFREGIALMNTGATYEFVMPANLGYGNNPPQGSSIYPGATLIFEVTLLDIL
jgi:FKBP-type peptidyl-prolyl cis-trans isomerase